MNRQKRTVALGVAFLVFLQQAVFAIPSHASLISDNQKYKLMPESSGHLQPQNLTGANVQKNNVLEVASALVITATALIGGASSSIKTISILLAADSSVAGTITWDTKTNKMTFTKSDGTVYSGAYNTRTKKGTFTSLDPAHPASLTMQFKTKTTTSGSTLIVVSLQIKESGLQRDYSFYDDGKLKSFTSVRTSTNQTETVKLNQLSGGRWEVSSRVDNKIQPSTVNYSGFASSAELNNFDLMDFNLQQESILKLTSLKISSTSTITITSYKENGIFKDRLVVRGGQTYIVVNQADYISGEADDIFIAGLQPDMTALAGYTMAWGERIEQNYSKGYGYILTSPTGTKTLIDFPATDLLRLSVSGQDKIYRVAADALGVIRVKDLTAELSNKIAELSALIDQNKSAWDSSALLLDSLLAGVDISVLHADLLDFYAAADKWKTATTNRALLDAVSLWTAQAKEVAGVMKTEDIESLREQLNAIQSLSQALYDTRQSWVSLAQSTQNYTVIENALLELENIADSFSSGKEDSFFAQLQPLQTAGADLQSMHQNISAFITSITDILVRELENIADPAQIQSSSLPPGADYNSTVYVDLNAAVTDFNQLILGSNAQWIDNGDELMMPGTLDFNQDMLAKAKAIAPTVLRYPGGDLADSYNWTNGIGTLADRYAKAYQNTRSQPILFGTDEMLKFAAELNAEPLFTVNIMTMTPQDAADWVRYTNSQNAGKLYNGKPLPKVLYWEIGNEPYLNSNITPEQYADKVNQFISAMKAVDPTIQCGVTLRTTVLWASDFNTRFLEAVTETFDYVTLHNSYLPLSYDGSILTESELYEAALAAATVIKNDFEAIQSLLKHYRPDQNILIAVTEFNALFEAQGTVLDTSKTVSFASALYVADILMAFAESPDVLMANFWSLTGNGDFGAVSNTGDTRPVYEVFKVYEELMKGSLVSLSLSTPTFTNASVGFVSNQNADSLSTLATLEQNTLRVLALNKDIDNPSSFRLMLPAGKTITSVRVKILSDSALFDPDSQASWIEIPCSPNGDYLDLNLDPHSIAYFEIEIQ